MSTPASAADKNSSGSLATPAASSHHDCSAAAGNVHLVHGRQRHRNAHAPDQRLPHPDFPPAAPSPSRAESPSAEQWSQPSSAFSLKRAATIPAAKPPRAVNNSCGGTQLSERDSIFATHYLPSDSDASPSNLPRPLQDDASSPEPIDLIPAPTGGPASPRSRTIPTRPRPMELVDRRATHPLRPSRRSTAAVRQPALLSPADTNTDSSSTSTSTTNATSSRMSLAAPQLDNDSNHPAATTFWETPQPFRPPLLQHPVAAKRVLADDPAVLDGLFPPALSDAVAPPLSMATAHDATSGERDRTQRSRQHFPPVRDVDQALAQYRSSSQGRRGRVEKSIEASLTKADPNAHVRSRKSSHYLGLFKQNTTSPDRKWRDEPNKSRDDRSDIIDHGPLVSLNGRPEKEFQLPPPPSHRPAVGETAEDVSRFASPKGLRTDDSVDTESVGRYADASSSPTARQYRCLPPNLLEEIRNFHLTPGGARGTSFSKSIPTQFSQGARNYAAEDAVLDADSPSSDLCQQETCHPSEEEEEQISSALYFPHETVTLSEEVNQYRAFDDGTIKEHFFEPATTDKPAAAAAARESSTGHVDISLRSENERKILSGDLEQDQVDAIHHDYTDDSFTSMSERSGDSTYESEHFTAEESSQSAREEESSLTDDAEMTPTATPTQCSRYVRLGRKSHAKAPPPPIGAVELKPYRHQVGGHTTVFRFSRRAVCKQLNNRENEFYERIERRHPEMLMFLPRYIGVLNVTFSKVPKLSKTQPEEEEEEEEGGGGGGETAEHAEIDNVSEEAIAKLDIKDSRAIIDESGKLATTEEPRIFSQKQVTGIIPQVTLENNRHIIPAGLFSRQKRARAADGSYAKKEKETGQAAATTGTDSQPDSSVINHDDATTSPASKRQSKSKSWGATTVNRKLQEQVLREVFSPPAIHHHRRHARGHLTLPRTSSDGLQQRRGNLSDDYSAQSHDSNSVVGQLVPPRSAAMGVIKGVGERSALSSSASTALEAGHARLESNRTGETPPRASSLNRTRHIRRRHSGSGLQRQRSITSDKTGDLVYYEDDGYGGDEDEEEDIFAMENDAAATLLVPKGSNAAKRVSRQPVVAKAATPERSAAAARKKTYSVGYQGDLLHTTISSSNLHYLPNNPKEARTNKDERVQFFLLLEDLTADMNKPCVLDLKMGTRQYGIEASEKKRKSQRQKCQTTTSQQLGVRLCGMQTWNVKKQEYLFEDKYFGRDLKSGRDFQDALTRFLYDGVSYASVSKKIPSILDRLGTLEDMIRKLKRYRFYASSLLILYDGEPATPGSSSADGRRDNKQASLKSSVSGGNGGGSSSSSSGGDRNVEVQLKIVDFANCVTGEDELPPDAPCPPHHPDDVDFGYLRGLRSLRMYFQRILKELNQEDFVERGEGEAMVSGPRSSGRAVSSDRYWDDALMESDPGEVSF